MKLSSYTDTECIRVKDCIYVTEGLTNSLEWALNAARFTRLWGARLEWVKPSFYIRHQSIRDTTSDLTLFTSADKPRR